MAFIAEGWGESSSRGTQQPWEQRYEGGEGISHCCVGCQLCEIPLDMSCCRDESCPPIPVLTMAELQLLCLGFLNVLGEALTSSTDSCYLATDGCNAIPAPERVLLSDWLTNRDVVG